MNKNNNNIKETRFLFEKSIIDLLKKEKKAMSISDISVAIRKNLQENELPPRNYFLQWVDNIKCLVRDDTIKKSMPYFQYKENIISNEDNFFKKFINDFNIWSYNYNMYKLSDNTNYKMWDDLKKMYDTCLDNIKIIDERFPKLKEKVKDLKVKKMPTEINEYDSSELMNIHQSLDSEFQSLDSRNVSPQNLDKENEVKPSRKRRARHLYKKSNDIISLNHDVLHKTDDIISLNSDILYEVNQMFSSRLDINTPFQISTTRTFGLSKEIQLEFYNCVNNVNSNRILGQSLFGINCDLSWLFNKSTQNLIIIDTPIITDDNRKNITDDNRKNIFIKLMQFDYEFTITNRNKLITLNYDNLEILLNELLEIKKQNQIQ